MKFVALLSGGKDSCFNIIKCVEYGHELVALANLYPEDPLQDEINSFMYQSAGKRQYTYVYTYVHALIQPLIQAIL